MTHYDIMKNTAYKIFIRKYALLLLAVICGSSAYAQIAVTPAQTAAALAQKLVGAGVTIANPQLTCPTVANGIFVSTLSTLGLDSGIVLTSGQAQTQGLTWGVNGNGTTQANGTPPAFASVSHFTAGDPQLSALSSPNTTNDACILEFDFIPAGDTIKFDYVFGSEEYPEYACSGFFDVFGFFISGPGIVGTKNIALVPGTNIPVGVNTINLGAGVNGSLPNCTIMGPGSPFAAYYINNGTSTTLTYDGITTVLQAISKVTPCSTYHLKLGVADASDWSFDSGVFLKAGSLTSNAISVTPVGSGGLSTPDPYCVRGCLPGNFVFSRPTASPSPLTIKYLITGTAINGVDYTLIPDSVVIPANGTTVNRPIFGLPANPATGPRLVKLLVLSPYSCNSTSLVIDSAELILYDSLQVQVLSNDTTVCRYTPVSLVGTGDPALTYTWGPAGTVSPVTGLTTTATPVQTTTYWLTATLAGSGCPPASDKVVLTVREEPDVDLGPDTTTCLNTPVQLAATVSPPNQPYTYSWTPATGLSSTTIANPTANPPSDITYYLEVTPGVAGCSGYDTINVRVLPDDFDLYTTDTAICLGQSVSVYGFGDGRFSYLWNPTGDVSDPYKLDPIITPVTVDMHTYTVTASFPGCPNMVKTLNIDVQPNPVVDIGPDREICQWDTVHINSTVSPGTYLKYTYDWQPAADILNNTSATGVFKGENATDVSLIVSTSAGCKGGDTLHVLVHPGNFATVDPPGGDDICPNDSLTFKVTGGKIYKWTPAVDITDPTAAQVTVYPYTTTYYTLLATDTFGCRDTFVLHVKVNPEAMLHLGEDVVLYPGESFQMEPTSNCMYFQWFPPVGLSATDIANPIAMPEVNTRYFVDGMTEGGCIARDSIDVLISPESILNIPNAFTPGNRLNNEIKIVKRGFATLKYFRIFNRWGEVIFETNDIEKGWDGTFNGEPQPMGVYIYTVEALNNAGRPFVKQGNITLIR